MIVVYILLAIVILMLMILIHELGHYVVGKLLGFKITEFSVGFFKPIWQKVNKKGEKISVRILPLGGYCAFYGEDGTEEVEDDNKENNPQSGENFCEKNKKTDHKEYTVIKDDPDFFTNKPAWKRLLVFSAGVLFNFLSAIIFSFILLVAFGYGNIYTVTDVNPYFQENYVAGTGLTQLEKNDKILAIDGKDISYVWDQTFDTMVTLKEGNSYTLTIEKAESGEILDINLYVQTEVVTSYNEETKQYETEILENGELKTTTALGFSAGMSSQALSFGEALAQCVPFTIGLAWMVIEVFWGLITGQIPITDLAGTITVISTMATTVEQSFSTIFVYLPLIAVNLAVFNFLPLPALDGGHAVFTTIEWIRGRPINRNIEAIIHAVGLIALLAFVIILDLLHFIL